MIDGAFTYPTDRDDWVKTVLIGGVLSFLGFLLLPLFVVYGYGVQAIRATIDGDDTPPAFEDWGTLFVDGLQAWIIGLIYLLIPGIVAFVTIGGSIAAMATGTRAGTAAGLAGLAGGLFLTLILSLIFGYFAVAAIVNFAVEESFGAGFDFGRLWELASSSEYLIAWIVSIVVFIVAGIVAGIPLIGFILGPFVGFYAFVVAARLWAGGFIEAIEPADPAAA